MIDNNFKTIYFQANTEDEDVSKAIVYPQNYVDNLKIGGNFLSSPLDMTYSVNITSVIATKHNYAQNMIIDNISVYTTNPNLEKYLPLKFMINDDILIEFADVDREVIDEFDVFREENLLPLTLPNIFINEYTLKTPDGINFTNNFIRSFRRNRQMTVYQCRIPDILNPGTEYDIKYYIYSSDGRLILLSNEQTFSFLQTDAVNILTLSNGVESMVPVAVNITNNTVQFTSLIIDNHLKITNKQFNLSGSADLLLVGTSFINGSNFIYTVSNLVPIDNYQIRIATTSNTTINIGNFVLTNVIHFLQSYMINNQYVLLLDNNFRIILIDLKDNANPTIYTPSNIPAGVVVNFSSRSLFKSFIIDPTTPITFAIKGRIILDAGDEVAEIDFLIRPPVSNVYDLTYNIIDNSTLMDVELYKNYLVYQYFINNSIRLKIYNVLNGETSILDVPNYRNPTYDDADRLFGNISLTDMGLIVGYNNETIGTFTWGDNQRHTFETLSNVNIASLVDPELIDIPIGRPVTNVYRYNASYTNRQFISQPFTNMEVTLLQWDSAILDNKLSEIFIVNINGRIMVSTIEKEVNKAQKITDKPENFQKCPLVYDPVYKRKRRRCASLGDASRVLGYVSPDFTTTDFLNLYSGV